MTAHRAPVPVPDPPLSDGRLTLRPWRLAEAAALVAAWADPEVARWTGVPPNPNATVARRWIQGDADRRAHGLSLDLVMDVDGVIAGEVGLASIDIGARTAEIGWWVSPGHRGQHLASSAAALVAGWAVEELCVDTVLARCACGNPGSGGVARAAGFELVGEAGDAELWRFTVASGATLGA
ncbi:MAG: GNAT family N-acetyltransferase [Acidimicrobiales bacterium]